MKGYIDYKAQIDQSNQTKKVVEEKIPRVFKIGTFVCLIKDLQYNILRVLEGGAERKGRREVIERAKFQRWLKLVFTYISVTIIVKPTGTCLESNVGVSHIPYISPNSNNYFENC